jgi:multiple sugar transport system substrate-binding protein
MFKNKYIALFVIALVIIGIGWATAYTFISRNKVANFPPVTLEYWGVWEQPEDIAVLTNAYTAQHPLVTINYHTFKADEYRDQLLKAWAQDRGPDLFMVPNTWVREYQQYATPMPSSMSVPAQFQTGTIKKETVSRLVQYPGYSTKNIKDQFLDVVYQDVVNDSAILGLPYSVDTMALYYNRALLQANNIAEPARTWDEIVSQASTISKLNSDNTFLQSTIALGTTNNIPNAFDIISLLMSQVGVKLTDGKYPTFADDDKALSAISFYLNFARPTTVAYSWNKDQANALDAFTAGHLAYFLGYNYHADQIRQTNPKLDWDVIPVPQTNTSVAPQTYANYWVTMVSKKSKNPSVAWQALSEMSSADHVKPYLDKTKKTTALRSLVKAQQQDLIIGPFAQNVLQAQSWYHGYNFPLAEKYFLDTIDAMAASQTPTMDSLKALTTQIRQTYEQPKN